ncbi:MAG: hypothetical protein KJ971_02440 [Firmicutes bacterium]|nr:hypothetical protein [Bacillota bacterium]
MTKILKTINQELLWIKKQYKTTMIVKKHSIGEELRYTLRLEKKNLQMVLKFIYYVEQDSLACFYDFLYQKTKKEMYHESFSLSDEKTQELLPGILKEDQEKLKELVKYQLKDGIIKSAVNPYVQADGYVEILKRNLVSMIEYAHNIKKKM